MLRFKDKVVVITGGAKGIGSRIGERFREEGAIVEIIDKIDVLLRDSVGRESACNPAIVFSVFLAIQQVPIVEGFYAIIPK